MFNWVLIGWFIGVPAVLLALWVGQVGPAANWGWSIVLAPWPIGIGVLFVALCIGAFDES